MHTIHICNNYILKGKGKGKGMPSHKNTLLYFLLFISTLYSNTTFAANRLVYCDGCGYFEEKELAEQILNNNDTLLIYNYATESMNKWVLNSTSSTTGNIYEEENEIVPSKEARRMFLNTANKQLKNKIYELRNLIKSMDSETTIVDLSNHLVFGSSAVKAFGSFDNYERAIEIELRQSGQWAALNDKLNEYQEARSQNFILALNRTLKSVIMATLQFTFSPSKKTFNLLVLHKDGSSITYNIRMKKLERGLVEALGFMVAQDALGNVLPYDNIGIIAAGESSWSGDAVNVYALANFIMSHGATIESVCGQQIERLVCTTRESGRADDGTPKYETSCTLYEENAC